MNLVIIPNNTQKKIYDILLYNLEKNGSTKVCIDYKKKHKPSIKISLQHTNIYDNMRINYDC